MIKNGNYYYTLKEDGTKKRFLEVGSNECIPVFPESIDFKITDTCTNGCDFCYMNATAEPRHASFSYIEKIMNQLPPGTELAIGGGNPLSHPMFCNIIDHANKRGLIPNVTVHIRDLTKELLNEQEINAIGVSVQTGEHFEALKSIGNNESLIVHAILGITPIGLIHNIIENGYKVLVLGLKPIGLTSHELLKEYSDNIHHVRNQMYDIIDNINDNVISFDCLAVKQLDLKAKLKDNFDDFYMGDDAKFTCYIDAVAESIHGSSLEPFGFELQNDLKEKFKMIRGA